MNHQPEYTQSITEESMIGWKSDMKVNGMKPSHLTLKLEMFCLVANIKIKELK